MPTWDEAKRRRNLRLHGLDFAGAEAIWDCPTVTREDRRKDYGEKRLVTFGLLDVEVVVLVYVERDDDMHIISLRRAEKYEARYYFETTKSHFG
jgi:uncharacterized DUF497 family protein